VETAKFSSTEVFFVIVLFFSGFIIGKLLEKIGL
jgi:hypothetical protein